MSDEQYDNSRNKLDTNDDETLFEEARRLAQQIRSEDQDESAGEPTPLTVEQLPELVRDLIGREHQYVRIEYCDYPPKCSIWIGVNEYTGDTPTNAMTAVRKWHEESMQATIDAHRDAQGQY